MALTPSEPVRKPLAECETAKDVGRMIERAIALSGREKKEASADMEYHDPSALSRWIAGIEAPQLWRLWHVRWLRQWLVVAMAELAGSDVEHTIKVRTRRSA